MQEYKDVNCLAFIAAWYRALQDSSQPWQGRLGSYSVFPEFPDACPKREPPADLAGELLLGEPASVPYFRISSVPTLMQAFGTRSSRVSILATTSVRL
jgi:hypothetical protein